MPDHTDTAEEHRSALDAFAELSSPERAYQPLPAVIDQQQQNVGAIRVAEKRDISAILRNLRMLAAAAGEDWYYRFPVKDRKRNTTSYIEGPSIKLTDEVAREWGNCNVGCMIRDMGDYWEIRAMFVDLQTGFALTRPFLQRKDASKLGGDDDGRRIEIAVAIGESKATRNVVLHALPTICDEAFRAAKNSLVQKIGSDIAGWRQRITERVTEHVELRRVELVIGRPAGEWLAADIAKIISLMKGVTDGMASLDETFPPIEAEKKSPTEILDGYAAATDNGPDAGADKPAAPAIGTDETAAGSTAPDPAADLLDRLDAALTAATTVEDIDLAWADLDIDARLEGDPDAHKRARKAATARQKAIGK